MSEIISFVSILSTINTMSIIPNYVLPFPFPNPILIFPITYKVFLCLSYFYQILNLNMNFLYVILPVSHLY